MTDMKKATVAKSGNIITPKGRLSYAQYLEKPNKNKKTGAEKYQLSILMPGDVDLVELKNAMGKIAISNVNGDQTRAKKLVEKRFLDPNDLPQGGKPAGPQFEGWILVRASSDYKPKFAYPNGTSIPDEEIQKELYSGRWARATLNPYWSNNDENPGVFLGLQNVQLLDHDENMGVRLPDAEEEFDAVDGVDAGSGSAPQNDSSNAAGDSDVDKMFG
jgi:hypothetical protein